MKLRSKEDLPLFLADANRLDLLETLQENEEIPDDLFEVFLQRRKPLLKGLMNFRASVRTKQQWRSSRFKFLRGIKRFHRSLAGKRLHRSLSRFLATRIMRPHMGFLQQRYESLEPLRFDALKALSSAKTHMYIESEYYSPLSAAEEYSAFMEYTIPLLNSIEWNVYNDPDVDLSEDEEEVLLRLVDERELCKSFAEILEVVPVEKVIETFAATRNNMITKGSSMDETYFFTRHMENFVPCLIDAYEKVSQNEKTSISL